MKNIQLRTKLILSFLFVGFAPLLIAGFTVWDKIGYAVDDIGLLLTEITITLILLAIGLTYYIARSVSNQLGSEPSELISMADDIVNGKLEREYADAKQSHSVYAAMLTVQNKLKESLECDSSKSHKTERLNQALENVTSIVMVADTDYNIVYINNIAKEFFSKIEHDIRSELPNFSVETLIGTNIDSFHKNPAHQRGLLNNLTSTFSSEVELGGHIMSLNVSPIISSNERLGTILEWMDLTAERSIESQVQGLVDASLEGDLSQRLDLSSKNGFLLRLSEGINNMVDVSENMINDTIRVLNAVSHGNLNEKIEAEYKGTFNQLKTDVNNTINKLTDIMKSIKESSDLVSTAAGEISRGNMDLSQRTESQAASLEETSASMEEMTSSVKQNADNSKHANELAIGTRELAEKSGDVVSEAVNAMAKINNALGKEVSLYDELEKGPVVIVWYRGGWCPYCNLQLQHIQRKLTEIHQAGGQVIAISPELPDQTMTTKEKQMLEFQVLSDVNNRVADQYKLAYTVPSYVVDHYDLSSKLSTHNGNDENRLPLAVTYVVGRSGVVEYAFLDADYKNRATPEEIISVLKEIN